MPARTRLLRHAVLTGCCLAALAATAAPHLDLALERQVVLAGERPNDAAVQNDLGNLLLVAGQEPAAEAAYRRALELDGNHEGARFNLGLLLQQHHEHGQALEHFERVLELDPRHAMAHYQCGVSLQELGRRKDAVDHYARAFGLDPSLSFAENNPQIIDNKMVTEALLMSSRYAVPSSHTVARQYDDAERIAQLMLEQAKAEAAAAAAKQAAAEVAGVEPKPVEPAEPTAPRGLGASLDDVPVVEPGTPHDDTRDDERTITEDDLGGGVTVGGAVGVPSTATPDLRNRDRRGAADRTPTAPRVIGGERAPATGLDEERYRPSRRSSASLDLRLLPEEEVG